MQPLHSDIESELRQENPVSSSSNQTDKSNTTGIIQIYVVIILGNKSVSSVVAAMLAGGYQMGSNVIDKAKAYDSKYLRKIRYSRKEIKYRKKHNKCERENIAVRFSL